MTRDHFMHTLSRTFSVKYSQDHRWACLLNQLSSIILSFADQGKQTSVFVCRKQTSVFRFCLQQTSVFRFRITPAWKRIFFHPLAKSSIYPSCILFTLFFHILHLFCTLSLNFCLAFFPLYHFCFLPFPILLYYFSPQMTSANVFQSRLPWY